MFLKRSITALLSSHLSSRSFRGYEEGFTLVEVLIASAVTSLLTIAGLSLWQGNIQATTTLLRGQDLRDNWGRVNLFINADISEACGASTTGGILTLRIKRVPTGDCTTNGDVVTVSYQVAGDVLQRTGPPIQRDGTIDTAGAVTTVNLLTGATFNPACTTAFRGCYELTLTSGTTTFTDTNNVPSAGRARVRAYP